MKVLCLFFLSSALTFAADFLTGQASRATIGQRNFTSQDTGTPSALQLGGVGGLAYANDMLLVTDSNRVQASPQQNRILIYRNISRFVLGPTAEIPQGFRCQVCVAAPARRARAAAVVRGQTDVPTPSGATP